MPTSNTAPSTAPASAPAPAMWPASLMGGAKKEDKPAAPAPAAAKSEKPIPAAAKPAKTKVTPQKAAKPAAAVKKAAPKKETKPAAAAKKAAPKKAASNGEGGGRGRAPRYAMTDVITIKAKDNPRRGARAERFAKYKNGMTVAQVYKVNPDYARNDLYWDSVKGFIKVGPAK
jgi:hypothetical protein